MSDLIDPYLLKILVCPISKKKMILDKKKNELISKESKLAYPIRNGIPILLPEEARKITAESERERTVILANAERDGEILRGQGDAGKNKILGEAFSRDPEFFSFYRSMKAYSLAINDEDTTMVLSPDSEFFKFFGNAGGDLKKR